MKHKNGHLGVSHLAARYSTEEHTPWLSGKVVNLSNKAISVRCGGTYPWLSGEVKNLCNWTISVCCGGTYPLVEWRVGLVQLDH